MWGSGGETCREVEGEGKWRGDVWGSGGETCREVEGRHVLYFPSLSGGETVPTRLPST